MPFPKTNAALERALLERGYDEPTAVQSAVMQPDADARDLLVSAQTGSGKTVAYGLAFAASLLGGDERFGASGAPLALIVAPTRELALQVQRELAWLYGQTGARIVSCIGGMDGQVEGRALQAGCHIVVGTPGRLCDHLRRGRLLLSDLRVLVLDEADEMLDLGFREELDQLVAACPAWRRTLLFSATISRDIAALAKQFQTDALRIDTLVRNQPHADIEYRAVRVAPADVGHAVVNLLRFFESPTALVFCATREGVRHLHAGLLERGFTSVALSGDLTQNERTRALQSLRDGRARVLVATDVAARGLDLPDLGLVIHADLPTDRAILLHRSGRTGRAGRKGVCVLVVPLSRQRRAEQLLAAAGVTASWSGAPAPEEIRARDSERLLQDPILAEPLAPEDLALADALMQGRTAQEIAAALIRLHRSRLPAPEELVDVGTSGKARPVESGPAQQRGATAWFSINVGRRNKADPKWLVPLICRLGAVQKRDIGAIRITDQETRFEIYEAAAAAVSAALPASLPPGGGPDGGADMVISPATAPAAPSARPGAAPRPRPAKPTSLRKRPKAKRA
jgi:ATP-dependent RNA helicase DeaD